LGIRGAECDVTVWGGGFVAMTARLIPSYLFID
jgi:hypothetical protein